MQCGQGRYSDGLYNFEEDLRSTMNVPSAASITCWLCLKEPLFRMMAKASALAGEPFLVVASIFATSVSCLWASNTCLPSLAIIFPQKSQGKRFVYFLSPRRETGSLIAAEQTESCVGDNVHLIPPQNSGCHPVMLSTLWCCQACQAHIIGEQCYRCKTPSLHCKVTD